MKRIVILSGSFNPPTLAHFSLLLSAVEHLGAEKGLFLPASDEYVGKKMERKGEKLVFSGEERFQMLSLCAQEDPRLGVCRHEIDGVSSSNFTYRSLKTILPLYPGYEFFYVIGADQLSNIPFWHDPEDFLTDFSFLVYEREGSDARETLEKEELLSRFKDKFVFCPFPDNLASISSTKVRQGILSGNRDYEKGLLLSVAAYLRNIKA